MFKPQELTVGFVFKSLKEISEITGTSVTSYKIDTFSRNKKSWTRLIGFWSRVRTAKQSLSFGILLIHLRYASSLEGKLRIGLAEQTVIVALAHAITLSQPGAKKWSDEKRTRILADAVSTLKQVYR